MEKSTIAVSLTLVSYILKNKNSLRVCQKYSIWNSLKNYLWDYFSNYRIYELHLTLTKLSIQKYKGGNEKLNRNIKPNETSK